MSVIRREPLAGRTGWKAGDLLGHFRDVGANPYDRVKPLYKTRAELGFHSDGSDIVALVCVHPAKFGGSNRLVSCGALYNEILVRRADLVPLLYEPFYWDRNNEESAGEDPYLIDEIGADPEYHFEFRLERGEINYLQNSAVLHMRTAFEDYADVRRKRHMVRLWLTAHGAWADGDAFVQRGIPVKERVVSDVAEIVAADSPCLDR